MTTARRRKAGWSVAPFYKYNFENALLISSQRPDATACATMVQWNRRNLWIRKGSRAIFALDSNNPYAVQRVFDISDINAPPERLPPIWTLSETVMPETFARLRDAWGNQDYPGDYSLQLYEGVLEATAEGIDGNDFEAARSESFMAGLDEDAAEGIFQALVVNSAFYIAAHRLGLPIPIDAETFEEIRYFDTWAMQMAIGQTAHEIAETILRQIERVVKDIERENARHLPESLDRQGKVWNNKGENSSQSQSIESGDGNVPGANAQPAEEREDTDGAEVAGDRIRGGPGRDARSGAGVSEAAGGQRGQVRRDEAGLSPEAPQGDLRTDAFGRDAEAAPDGRERTGERHDREVDEQYAKNRPSAGQCERPASVGAAHLRGGLLAKYWCSGTS